MSPSSAAAHQWAVVAPTFPAPTMVIFARRIWGGFRIGPHGAARIQGMGKYKEVSIARGGSARKSANRGGASGEPS